SNSTLIAGGKIRVEDPKKLPKQAYSVAKENETSPLGFIKFFELSQVGLGVKAANSMVTVEATTAGSVSEKAGLKVGDTILEVNGKKPDSAESLRRLLRDALAVGDATVTLKRGEKTETVKIALPE